MQRASAATALSSKWAGRRIVLEDGTLGGPEIFNQRSDLRQLLDLDAQLDTYTGPDITLAAWLAERGISGLARHIADIRMAHAYCATPESLSMAELVRDSLASAHNGQGDFHILPGYDTILNLIAAGLDIRLSTPVVAIRWNNERVEITLANRDTLCARAAICTLPLALLKEETVHFDPALPHSKRRAVAGLAMQPAMKVIYRFAAPFWDANMAFLNAPNPRPTWWTIRVGAPLLTNFITGPRAARAAQDVQIVEHGLDQLEHIFGTAPRTLFQQAKVVDWTADPWARGGYSSPPLGSAGMRAALAAPCGALHFAGEATVTNDSPATVHGAMVSGERAAREVLRPSG